MYGILVHKQSTVFLKKPSSSIMNDIEITGGKNT